MSRPEDERTTWKGHLACCVLAMVVVPLSFMAAVWAQRPLRGPVFIDLGAFPGPQANGSSIGVAVIVYALPVCTFLFGAQRLAPGWAVKAATVVSALGGLVLLVVVV